MTNASVVCREIVPDPNTQTYTRSHSVQGLLYASEDTHMNSSDE